MTFDFAFILSTLPAFLKAVGVTLQVGLIAIATSLLVALINAALLVFRTPYLSRLVAPTELALMLKLADYPAMLSRAAASLAPHDVAFYLRDVAAAFHSYYAAERFLVDDAELARARLALLAATRQVLRNALSLLGVSAPESMNRAEEAQKEPA